MWWRLRAQSDPRLVLVLHPACGRKDSRGSRVGCAVREGTARGMCNQGPAGMETDQEMVRHNRLE